MKKLIELASAERQLDQTLADALVKIASAELDMIQNSDLSDLEISSWAEQARRSVSAAHAEAIKALRTDDVASLKRGPASGTLH